VRVAVATLPHRTTQAPRRYFSKVLGRALGALDAVRTSTEPVSLHDLAHRLHVPKASLFRLLYTLEASGYVGRDASGRYQLSRGLTAPSRDPSRDALLRAALPHVRDLVRACGETASVAMRFDHHIEVIATIDSPQIVRMGSAVGRVLPPHASALGKAILACQGEDQRERLVRSYGLHRFTAHTIVDPTQLAAELDIISARGYSLDTEECVPEGCCFGAPIRGRRGGVSAAISVSLPRMRVRGDDGRERLIAAVCRAAGHAAADLE
jgi:IclR family acetate operon transcriptional repressor